MHQLFITENPNLHPTDKQNTKKKKLRATVCIKVQGCDFKAQPCLEIFFYPDTKCGLCTV